MCCQVLLHSKEQSSKNTQCHRSSYLSPVRLPVTIVFETHGRALWGFKKRAMETFIFIFIILNT